MRWLSFKWVLTVFVLLSASTATRGATIEDSISSSRRASVNERFEQSVRSFWERMTPRYFKSQFAGSIGVVSVGFGWDYGKHRQWETDVMVGLVPRCSSTRAKPTFTLKQNYVPWHLNLCMFKGDNLVFEPLRCGIFFNTVYGEEFWTQEPDRYPSGYYNFSTRIRTGIFLGESITLKLEKNMSKRFFKNISFYYELVSSDIYIISAFTNGYLKLSDIINISFGLKWQFLDN